MGSRGIFDGPDGQGAPLLALRDTEPTTSEAISPDADPELIVVGIGAP